MAQGAPLFGSIGGIQPLGRETVAIGLLNSQNRGILQGDLGKTRAPTSSILVVGDPPGFFFPGLLGGAKGGLILGGAPQNKPGALGHQEHPGLFCGLGGMGPNLGSGTANVRTTGVSGVREVPGEGVLGQTLGGGPRGGPNWGRW